MKEKEKTQLAFDPFMANDGKGSLELSLLAFSI
jgi:hypothetical protein